MVTNIKKKKRTETVKTEKSHRLPQKGLSGMAFLRKLLGSWACGACLFSQHSEVEAGGS
jgi:hypothetical protein